MIIRIIAVNNLNLEQVKNSHRKITLIGLTNQ